MKIFKNKKTNSFGISLVEMVIYAAIFSTISIVLISFLVGALQAWTSAKTQRDLIMSAQNTLNIIAQVIRPAKNIYLPESSLGVNLGALSVTTEQNPPAHNVKFYVTNNTLYEQDDAAPAFAITPDNISVSQFQINTITSSSTPQGVQISLGLASKTIPAVNKTFYATAVWRGGY
jgi:type II secretory pathway component PulJ